MTTRTPQTFKSIQMDTTLFDALTLVAAAEHRSMVNLIQIILRDWVAAQEGKE